MKKQKKFLVSEEYIQIFNTFPFIIAFHYNHLVINDSVLEKKKQELQQLIEKMNIGVEKSSVHLKVVKNKLMQSSLKKSKYKNISTLFSGPTLLLYTTIASPVVCEQILEWKKNDDNFIFLGGKYENDLISVNDLVEITKLSKSKEESIIKTIGILNNPIIELLNVLSQNQLETLNTLQMIKKEE
uniref:Ribosomal protein L10 n=1 Tax=Reclinomonas americana ATCC 50283 TaxID=1295594 RepID=M4QDY5_RECAM|nr:ribosomal protein L10 [Reclinomonas americana ATCC 50283]